MSRLRFGILTIGALTLGCSQSSPSTPVKPIKALAQTPAPAVVAASTAAIGDFVIGEPIRFQNLTIFPIASRTPKTDDRFVTLDEGLKAGTVEIHEAGSALLANAESQPPATDDVANVDAVPSALSPSQPQAEPRVRPLAGNTLTINNDPSAIYSNDASPGSFGNDVNSLVVINRSDKPLYLMPGEVIVGGSQDRTIGDELVIAPHSKPTRISVFCVEHGRWGDKQTEETLQQLTASAGTAVLGNDRSQNLAGLAQIANEGRFIASVGQLNKSSRLAVQSDKDQAAVWDNVAFANDQSGVRPISGAFTANYSDAATIKRLQPYLDHFQKTIAKQDQIVGVLAAVNGKIESMDVFESTPLFQKVWPKLLGSYALDAANVVDESADAKECLVTDARAFLAEALEADVETSDTEQGVALTKRNGRNVVSFSSQVDAAAMPSAMMGGMGSVHFSGFSK